ncbi:hypothetical protein [Paenibacillus roseipurpureus]|uniref:Uncharacterized protein n=1 Tax=Paenibacillus roseopurpureus TaxID=2918901 RepID=A0AA96LME9_9BACL|nr:hypothetical protein [Paenibacillus sp. MBLB1832]WNR42504.1 hypothetical protein MJB10_15370 [Paenibacillus sp. MBLB1832]
MNMSSVSIVENISLVNVKSIRRENVINVESVILAKNIAAVNEALKDRGVQQGQWGRWDPKEGMGLKVMKVMKDLRGQRDLRDRMDIKVIKEIEGTEVLRDIMGHIGHGVNVAVEKLWNNSFIT